MSNEVFKKALKNLTEEDIRNAEEQIAQLRESKMKEEQNMAFDTWSKNVRILGYVSYVKKSGIRKMGQIILIRPDGLRVNVEGMINACHVNWYEIQEVGLAPIMAGADLETSEDEDDTAMDQYDDSSTSEEFDTEDERELVDMGV